MPFKSPENLLSWRMPSPDLRLIFMGSPDIVVPALEALHNSGLNFVGVYCQPPRPKGRGEQVQPCPVQIAAEKLGLPVFTPVSLKKPEAQAELAALRPDLAIVAAYGLILPKAVLEAPRLGCINIHPSILPRWRGAAPVVRAMLAGDAEVGTTIMQLDEGVDTGAMWVQQKFLLDPAITAPDLHRRLFTLGAEMILGLLPELETRHPTPQPEQGVTHAAKLSRMDGLIDWSQSAALIDRQVRALTPWPGVACQVAGEPLKVLAVQMVDAAEASPGTLLDDQGTVACGEGAIKLLRVQRAGRAPVSGADFLRGSRLLPGACFENGA